MINVAVYPRTEVSLAAETVPTAMLVLQSRGEEERTVPENWLDIAGDARKSASTLLTEDHYRSAVARAYYAAYSKITHSLVSVAGLPMPPGREGPSHSRIGRIFETSMPHMTQAKRDKLSELLGRLYTLRIDADYRPSIPIGIRDARAAISLMTTVFYSF